MTLSELTYSELKVLTPDQRREHSFNTLDDAKAALKAVKTYQDFREFYIRLESCTGYFHHTDLCMKRSGYSTQAHQPAPWNRAKCYYQVCDGRSTGCARWENLYRVFEIRIQWVTSSHIVDAVPKS